MNFFASYLIMLAWAIVIALSMAITYGFSIWILEKLLMEIKGLRHMMKKPIASAIVVAAFVLSVAIIVATIVK